MTDGCSDGPAATALKRARARWDVPSGLQTVRLSWRQVERRRACGLAVPRRRGWVGRTPSVPDPHLVSRDTHKLRTPAGSVSSGQDLWRGQHPVPAFQGQSLDMKDGAKRPRKSMFSPDSRERQVPTCHKNIQTHGVTSHQSSGPFPVWPRGLGEHVRAGGWGVTARKGLSLLTEGKGLQPRSRLPGPWTDTAALYVIRTSAEPRGSLPVPGFAGRAGVG